MLLVTNNPMVEEKINCIPKEYVEVDYGEVLQIVKQHIIKNNYVLLTHPLSGSIKPNETYYKSIILDDNQRPYTDLASLELIEDAEAVYDKFMKNKMRPNWTEKVLKDFAYVDYYIMRSTFECMQMQLPL